MKKTWLGIISYLTLSLCPLFSQPPPLTEPTEPVPPIQSETVPGAVDSEPPKTENPVTPIPIQPDPTPQQAKPVDTEIEDEAPTASELNLISVAARMDLTAVIGNPTYQGFSLPSVRFSAYGGASPAVGYRLSVGQTREFSSALINQLIPVEAYVDLYPVMGEVFQRKIRIRTGLFTPQYNPWWSADLSDLVFPDYLSTHTLLFVSRDLGVEVRFALGEDTLLLSVGYVNGNGILSLNTNSTKTLIGSAKLSLPVGASRMGIGWGGYSLRQAALGSINFKSNSIHDIFAFAEGDWGVLVGEFFFGKFSDSTRGVFPSGGAGSLMVRPFENLWFFVRGEGLANPPTGNGPLSQWQVGPILHLNSATTLFSYFKYNRVGVANQYSGEVRLRLSM